VGSVLALVATVSQYFFAPLTEDQLKFGVVETFVAPLEGADRLGAGRLAASVGDQGRKDATSKNHLPRTELGDGSIKASGGLSAQIGWGRVCDRDPVP
jgi:hypothetical protein